MRLDTEIKRDVQDELRWDTDIDATDIGVAVHNGVVTLTGFVCSYVRNAKRVVGIANDIELRLPALDQRPDADIVRHAVTALWSELPYPSRAAGAFWCHYELIWAVSRLPQF